MAKGDRECNVVHVYLTTCLRWMVPCMRGGEGMKVFR